MYLVCIQESVYAASFSEKLANKYCKKLPPVKRQRSQITEEGALRNWEETIPPNVVAIEYDKSRIFIAKDKDRRVYGWWVGECPLLVFPEDIAMVNNWIG